MKRGKRLNKLVVAFGVSALGLSACASLPTAGPVHEGKTNVRAGATLYQQAELPTKGAQPEHLIRDFQQACAAGTYDEYSVARQYLTPQARRRWKPEQKTVVLREKNGLTLTTGSDSNTIRGTGTAVLQIDEYGLNQLPESTQQVLYTLEQVDGEWRIADLPDGVFLSETAFQTAYALRSAYFFTPDRRSLVADPRWVPRSQAAKQLVKAILSGPSRELTGTVFNALTLQTLTSGIVEVTGKNMQVKIPSGTVFSQERAEWLYRQLTRTLDFGSGIETIQISQSSVPYDLPSLPAPEKERGGHSVGVASGQVWSLAVGGVERPLTGAGSGTWSWPTAVPGTADPVFALFTPQGSGNVSQVRQIRGDGALLTLQSGANLLPPQADQWGWVWSVSSDNVETLAVAKAEQAAFVLDLPGSVQGKVATFSLGPDGMRVLLTLETEGQSQIHLLAVQRDQQGRPRALVNDRTLLSRPGIYSTGWINSTQAAVLSDPLNPTVTVLSLNSQPRTVEAPKDAARVLSYPPRDLLQVATKDNLLYTRIGYAWRAGQRLSEYQSYVAK